jgi:hypothetical protein
MADTNSERRACDAVRLHELIGGDERSVLIGHDSPKCERTGWGTDPTDT